MVEWLTAWGKNLFLLSAGTSLPVGIGVNRPSFGSVLCFKTWPTPRDNMHGNEQQVFSAYIFNYFLKLVPYKHFSDCDSDGLQI